MLFGATNAFCYGLSHLMEDQDYEYYFGYKGNGKYFDAIRSQFGCDKIRNAWTAPFMIGAGWFMQGKVGAMTMLKFTPLAFLTVLAF